MENTVKDEIKEFRAGTDRARKEIEEAGSKLRDQAEDAWEDLSALVKKHPAKALGVTLVAGVAVGLLSNAMSRKRYSASDNIKNLAGSGTEAWQKVREGFEEAVCTMKSAVEEAVGKFK